MKFYAHSPVEGGSEWHDLEEHLRSVAELARGFGDKFGGGYFSYLVGLLHDYGKSSEEFQQYIGAMEKGDESDGRVDHSTAGAKVLYDLYGVYGLKFLANVVAGHHAGLYDEEDTGYGGLDKRLSVGSYPQPLMPVGNLIGCQDRDNTVKVVHEVFDILKGRSKEEVLFGLTFFARMVFSTLIDADRLDTGAFYGRSAVRDGVGFEELRGRLDKYYSGLGVRNYVDEIRNKVLGDCRRVGSEGDRGFYTLTVPTGGGKTLSSLAFGLEHVVKHKMDRIIYVVPFTSIIEQNVDVFRKVIGDACVVEHHSNLDADKETEANKRASENWDSEVVVTTAVQFYESLYTNKTSRARKLHNICNSVIILDEAQSIPVELLEPCLAALKELVRGYGCTVVLCTATQPNFENVEFGLRGVREIVSDVSGLYEGLKRVDVEYLGDLGREDLVERMLDCGSVLSIVNTRMDARELAERDSSFVHLSTTMCPVHRLEVLNSVRERLERGEGVRVVSTTLIEAGVDIDFPVVYRALSGIDSIAQAAGRCNRNGKLDKGKVYVYKGCSNDVKDEKFILSNKNAGERVIKMGLDILSTEAVEKYFDLYYYESRNKWDEKKVMECFEKEIAQYATGAMRFKMIDERGRPLFIPYDKKACSILESVRKWGIHRDTMRRAQRYIITVPEKVWEKERNNGNIVLYDDFPVLGNMSFYDKRVGLKYTALGFDLTASALVC